MTDYKSALQSRTVWAGIVTIIAAVLGAMGVTFGVEDQADTVDAILAIVTALGGIWAIVGRVKATKRIGK